MDAAEVTRRLEIARLAVEYYEAQQRGEPFEVQYWSSIGKWCDRDDPPFDVDFNWRRKPREPRRLILHRYRDLWQNWGPNSEEADETATFIEVLPETNEPKRWWVREDNLFDSREKCERWYEKDEHSRVL